MVMSNEEIKKQQEELVEMGLLYYSGKDLMGNDVYAQTEKGREMAERIKLEAEYRRKGWI
jgi:hypothetical protein